jgi:uncharacterized membrane protein HdeD (DUF308 family)
MADGDQSTISVPTLAAAAIGFVTGAAAIYRGYTGTLARLSRNDANVIPIAVALTFLAIIVSVVAGRHPKKNDKPRNLWPVILLSAGLILAGVAAGLVTSGISRSLGTTDRPRITPNGGKNSDLRMLLY